MIIMVNANFLIKLSYNHIELDDRVRYNQLSASDWISGGLFFSQAMG
jgi:hypothetical protein